MLAAAVFAVAPSRLGGVVVRARSGPVRDQWMALALSLLAPDAPQRRIPLNVGDDRLLGGLDLAATLKSGRPVFETGILALAHGGVVIIPSAERLEVRVAAHITGAMDRRDVAMEREGFTARPPAEFGMIAFDEGAEPDEHVSPVLADRAAFHIDLEGLTAGPDNHSFWAGTALYSARERWRTVNVPDSIVDALVGATLALGIDSARAPLFALDAARVLAALDDRDAVDAGDAEIVARLVLSSRATRVPAEPDAQEPEADPPPPPDEQQTEEPANDSTEMRDGPLEDRVLAAAKAAIPADVLAALVAGQKALTNRRLSGKSGAAKPAKLRGRPTGARKGPIGRGQRINVVETLRAAAPWQTLRRREASSNAGKTGGTPRVLVRSDDFRVARFKARSETTTIFAVDASGSAALHRLAEAKGAVELLLAECYVRRDSVAMLAFRGRGAEVLLPPTRSLVRAKRCLAALPGGGGTPLAAGIDAAVLLAEAIARKGPNPAIVFLTDGKANVARDGTGGRGPAERDAIASATALKVRGFKAVLIDVSPSPQVQAETLARAMGAIYLPLPFASSAVVSRAVQSAIGRD